MQDIIIIQIVRSSDKLLLVDLHHAPRMPDPPMGVESFECSPEELPLWTEQDGVRKRGQRLLELLREASRDVKFALDRQLNGHGEGQTCPIYFWLKNAGEAEQLCWEALCDSNGKFLALNQWHIARIAAGARGRPPVDLRTEPIDASHPLRVALVLAASKVEAEEEWNGFYEAAKEAREKGLAMELHVFVGEEKLSDKIAKQAKEDKGIRLQAIGRLAIKLEQRLKQAEPHLVHFFCHGSTTFNKPRLEIATFLSWPGRTKDNPHIEFDLDQLLNIPAVKNAWLVTLNCCKGGAATSEMLSLTYRLVERGVAASVGMLEEVDAGDAHAFCRFLYPAVFGKIQEALAEVKGGKRVELDWASTLYHPRAALRDLHGPDPGGAREWTLPVLYRPLETLELYESARPASAGLTPDAQRQRAHRETIATLLRFLPPQEAAILIKELENPQ